MTYLPVIAERERRERARERARPALRLPVPPPPTPVRRDPERTSYNPEVDMTVDLTI